LLKMGLPGCSGAWFVFSRGYKLAWSMESNTGRIVGVEVLECSVVTVSTGICATRWMDQTEGDTSVVGEWRYARPATAGVPRASN
jgi:hypothetical protein